MPQRDHTTITAIEAWRVSPTSRIWVGGNNTEARREIELLVGEAQRPPEGELDCAIIAPLTTDEAVYFARKVRSRLAPRRAIWIVYPKRGSSAPDQLTGNFDDMVVALFELGFAEVGVAALNEIYTSTGFYYEGAAF
jgi:hypothetical protein